MDANNVVNVAGLSVDNLCEYCKIMIQESIDEGLIDEFVPCIGCKGLI
jgi:hypothetical protein